MSSTMIGVQQDLSQPLNENTSQESSVSQGTLFSSVMNLSATAMGAAILSLPISFSYCGWLGGSILLLLIGLMSDYSLILLVKAARSSNEFTIEGIGRVYFGQKGALFVKCTLLALLFGAILILLIVMGDLTTPSFQHFALGGNFLKDCPSCPNESTWWSGTQNCTTCQLPPWWSGRATVSIVLTLLMFPLLMSRNLSALKYKSSSLNPNFFFHTQICT